MNAKKTTLSFVMSKAICCGSLFFAFLLLASLYGCLPAPGSDRGSTSNSFTTRLADMKHTPGHTSRISCFLNLKDQRGPAIRLEVSSIEVFNENTSLLLNAEPLILDSQGIGTGQFFLGGVALPPGNYNRLRLTVTRGEVQKTDGKFEVIATEPFPVDVNLKPGLNLEAEDSPTVHITWDVQNSLLNGNTLAPDLIAAPSLRQMLLNLVLVSCPEIDTVFVVRADNNWVVDSFGLKGGPTYLAVDPVDRNLLYVLASRDRMVKVVELSTFRVVNFFPVPLNDEPTFMVISPDGQDGFLLDENNGYLSRVNLRTGRIDARVLLSDRPVYMAYLEEQNVLAVVLSLSQKVLLLHPHSLGVTRTIATGSGPQGLITWGNQLFLAEYGENSVSVTDLSSRGTQNRLLVGFGPRRLLKTENQIYVSNYQDGSLSVLMPGQFGVIQEIYGLGRPLDMALNPSYRRLFVTDEMQAALAVIDTNSNRIIEFIALGARPFDLDVIQ